jgi:putative drug exporter of the RND superfamily
MGTPDVAAARGVFQRLADLVVRWPLVVIAFWIALAAVLSLALPPLSVIAGERQSAALPNDAPVMVTGKEMAQAFHETGSVSMLLVILTDEKGLGPADEETYRTLVDKLRQDSRDVHDLQDFFSTPPLREVVQSKDNKAWNLPISLNGDTGSPEARSAYKHVADLVKQTVAGSTLTPYLTGPAATVADMAEIGQRDQHLIEIGTAVLVLLILLIVYRNPVTMLVPLITIGISLATAQGVLAALAKLGLGVMSETIVLMTAVMIGAATDYAVFLISRYHDYVRLGADSDQAVKRALASIGKVIAASAATVAITFLAMMFSRLPVFTTVGPAISISIAVAFLAAVSLLPAMLVLAGRRGWIRPRRDLTNRFWRRSGIRIVRRPKTHLVASFIALIVLASCASLARFNYDDRKSLPGSAESAVGYAAMDRHFSSNTLLPQFLFVQSPNDLRNPQALADLEQMAQRVSQVPGVELVRGITRPAGESLQQARATYQAGEVGTKLGDASKTIIDHHDELDLLTHGENELADSLAGVRGQVAQAIGTVSVLADTLSSMLHQVGGEKTLKDLDNAAQLITSMHALGDAIGVNFTGFADSLDWVGPVLAALDANTVCNADPSCANSRVQMQRLVTARNDGTFDKIANLGRQLQSAQPGQTLNSMVTGLRSALATATNALQFLGGGLRDRLTTLQQGADALADGSRKLADGVQLLVDQVKQMGGGLSEASTFLLAMRSGANKPSMTGFYVPPQVLTRDDFKQAAAAFISPDGHATRYLVQTKLNPFSTAAMDQVNSITAAARGAQPNTALADAKISMAGFSVGLRDTRDYYDHDVQFFVLATIIIVLLILMVLLRAIVAALYLICSVVISYLSALGIGVIVFQFILGQELHWSVPGLTFILLVAMGADYNLLLISRIRDESPHGVRLGVIRTVGSTGGVITSAGLIFAASMFGLLLAGISTMVQVGFVIGMGILLDTFLVRTITVPAIAVLIGQANWWPHQWWPRLLTPVRRRRGKPTPHRLVMDVAVRGGQTCVNLPPTVTEHHRHRGRRNQRHLVPLLLPPVGRNGVPKPPVTNGLEMAPDNQMTANGRQPAEVTGQQPAETNGRHLAGTNGHEAGKSAPVYRSSEDYRVDKPRSVGCRLGSDATVETNGQHTTGTNGKQPVETNGKQPAETPCDQPAESNGHEPVKTPSVEPSCEDDRVSQPRWIGRWPASDCTFPLHAHNGHLPTTNELETAGASQMTLNGEQPFKRRHATACTQTSREQTYSEEQA